MIRPGGLLSITKGNLGSNNQSMCRHCLEATLSSSLSEDSAVDILSTSQCSGHRSARRYASLTDSSGPQIGKHRGKHPRSMPTTGLIVYVGSGQPVQPLPTASLATEMSSFSRKIAFLAVACANDTRQDDDTTPTAIQTPDVVCL